MIGRLTRRVKRNTSHPFVHIYLPHSVRSLSTLKPGSSHSAQASNSQIFKPRLERSADTARTLSHQCASCGILLQSGDKDAIGYYVEPKKEAVVPTYQSKRLQFLSAYSKLDEGGKNIIQSLNGGVQDQSAFFSRSTEELVCQRCHDALYHNVYKESEHQPVNLYEVLDNIPRKDNILQVFSAYDFPLSLVPLHGKRNVMYVLNKIDLLCGFDSVVRKYATYFRTVLNRLTAGKRPMTIVSSHTSWSISDLLRDLHGTSHLVGYVNAGKSRLANRLVNLARQSTSPGAKNIKPIGSSHLPAMTRDSINHTISGGVTIIDTPGFLHRDNVFKHIKQVKLKQVMKGRKVLVSDLRKKHYESLNGGQCITAGGIVFIKAPRDTIVQVKPICEAKAWVFSSVEKAIETVKQPPEALSDAFIVNPESMDDIVRYVIPPFIGTVDVIVKDIGYIQLKPTGGKHSTELFEVWAPRGVILGVRESIEHFLTRYLKKTVIKTIKTGKKKGQEKEVTEMRPKNIEDFKVFSRLYEIPMDCVDPEMEMKAQYDRHIREFGSSYYKVGPDDKRDESKNKYWIEKL